MPLAVAQPADPRRKSLEGNAFAGQPDPACEGFVLREQFQHRAVGGGDVLGVTRQRSPAERAVALAEQRTDVCGHEAREVERALAATEFRLAAQGVAVVEDLGALVEEAEHRVDVVCHRLARAVGELVRLLRRVVVPILDADALRQVGQRVVRGGLVGDDVDLDTAPQQLRQHLGGVADDGDGQGAPFLLRSGDARDGVVEVVGDLVQVAGLDPAVCAVRVAFDDQADAVVHGDGERLRPAHPAAPGGQRQGAGEGTAEPFGGHRGERLVRALQDALRADVDPGAGGHLPVHGQAELLQAPELRPGRPVADQVGVGDEHPRRPLVRPEHADRLAGLDEQRLVGVQSGQFTGDRVEAGPVARRLAGAAVDDQVLWALGDVRVEVVVEHPQRRFGLPVLGGELGTARGADRAGHQTSRLAAARTAPDRTSSSAAAISGAT